MDPPGCSWEALETAVQTSGMHVLLEVRGGSTGDPDARGRFHVQHLREPAVATRGLTHALKDAVFGNPAAPQSPTTACAAAAASVAASKAWMAVAPAHDAVYRAHLLAGAAANTGTGAGAGAGAGAGGDRREGKRDGDSDSRAARSLGCALVTALEAAIRSGKWKTPPSGAETADEAEARAVLCACMETGLEPRLVEFRVACPEANFATAIDIVATTREGHVVFVEVKRACTRTWMGGTTFMRVDSTIVDSPFHRACLQVAVAARAVEVALDLPLYSIGWAVVFTPGDGGRCTPAVFHHSHPWAAPLNDPVLLQNTLLAIAASTPTSTTTPAYKRPKHSSSTPGADPHPSPSSSHALDE